MIRKYVEAKLDKTLLAPLDSRLKDRTNVVILGAEFHAHGRTYGRNSESAINEDVKNLEVAADADEKEYLDVAASNGYNLNSLKSSFAKLNSKNKDLFKKISNAKSILDFLK